MEKSEDSNIKTVNRQAKDIRIKNDSAKDSGYDHVTFKASRKVLF